MDNRSSGHRANWLTSRHTIETLLSRREAGTLMITAEGERNRRTAALVGLARRHGVTVERVTPETLRKTAGSSARGVAFAPEGRTSRGEHTVVLRDWLAAHRTTDPSGPVVAVDHVTDPHNLGAILRSAHLFGVSLVVLPARRSVLGGDVVERSSAGAASMVARAIVPNLVSALRECQQEGFWIYAADMAGDPLPQVSFARRAVVVVGAEGKGITPSVRQRADHVVSIPLRAPEGTTVDSLNVSVATGILLYTMALAHQGYR